MMRALAAAAATILLVLAPGCGGEKPQPIDTAPFQAALEDYLRAGSMEMKVDKIESVEVAGNQATAKARMATKEALYGMKPVWTVVLVKQGQAWKVKSVEH